MASPVHLFRSSSACHTELAVGADGAAPLPDDSSVYIESLRPLCNISERDGQQLLRGDLTIFPSNGSEFDEYEDIERGQHGDGRGSIDTFETGESANTAALHSMVTSRQSPRHAAPEQEPAAQPETLDANVTLEALAARADGVFALEHGWPRKSEMPRLTGTISKHLVQLAHTTLTCFPCSRPPSGRARERLFALPCFPTNLLVCAVH